MTVRLHIERLVVDGMDFAPGGGARLQAAAEMELTRLLTDGGMLSNLASTAVPSLSVGSIPLESNPSRLGVHVARAVYDGLKR